MYARLFRLICLLSCLVFAAAGLAQEGHPLKGSWVGEWGPTSTQRNHVVVVMDWDGQKIIGAVNPGTNPVPLKMVRLDITPGNPDREARGKKTPAKPGPPTPPTFKVHIEADTKDAKGNPVTIVADGSVQDIGIPSRWIAGTWTQTSAGSIVKGDFKIRRQ